VLARPGAWEGPMNFVGPVLTLVLLLIALTGVGFFVVKGVAVGAVSCGALVLIIIALVISDWSVFWKPMLAKKP
jgi:hypothetical protein